MRNPERRGFRDESEIAGRAAQPFSGSPRCERGRGHRVGIAKAFQTRPGHGHFKDAEEVNVCSKLGTAFIPRVLGNAAQNAPTKRGFVVSYVWGMLHSLSRHGNFLKSTLGLLTF